MIKKPCVLGTAVLIGALARANAAVIGGGLIRVDGNPAACGHADAGRKGSRENPVVKDDAFDRALQAKVLGLSVDKDEAGVEWIALSVVLQLVDCVQSPDGEYRWLVETPDSKDSAEAIISTGWFNGMVRNSLLTPSKEAEQDVYVAGFRWKLLDALRGGERKKYLAGEEASFDIALRYLYQNPSRTRGPQFPVWDEPFKSHYGSFPSYFDLTARVARGRAVAARMDLLPPR